jgi:hypothetical protein
MKPDGFYEGEDHMPKAQYIVSIPVSIWVAVSVTADNAKDAKRSAKDAINTSMVRDHIEGWEPDPMRDVQAEEADSLVDDDPQCVCGVYRSEHGMMGCTEGFQTAGSWAVERKAIQAMSDDEFERRYYGH